MSEYTHEEVYSIVLGGDEMSTKHDALEFDYTNEDPSRGALRVARVLLFPPTAGDTLLTERYENSPETAFERLMDSAKNTQRNDLHSALAAWFIGSGLQAIEQAYYPLFLYNRDYLQTRAIIDMLLVSEAPIPRYLSLLCLNMFRQVLDVSHTELHARINSGFGSLVPLYNELFRNAERVREWISRKKQPLFFYGSGPSNIALRYNDKFFLEPKYGFSEFNRDAEARYDLGGGFNTSEVERCLGRTFISADINPPRITDLDDDLIIQTRKPDAGFTVANDVQRADYFARQARIQYLPFDVLSHSFPGDAHSYAFVSSGFITSTVRPANNGTVPPDDPASQKKLGPTMISLYGIQRVVEMAATGNDVDFFTIMRATSRVFKYKTCHVQWRNGVLSKLHTVDDHARIRWLANVQERASAYIDPDISEFSKYL